jgi:2-desacetyl-2-hydroxyethyl bacteriochlorophyllide A dehydrogenase
MRQVVLQEPGRLVGRDAPPPVCGTGEALVRVGRVGLCGTDFHAFEGTQPFFSYPRVLGHELAVTVESVPEGTEGLRAGDRCAVRPFLFNPASRASRRGRTNCCEDLRVLGVHVDGGMGELLAVPPSYLHASASLSLDDLALVEPLSIGCHAVRRGQPSADDEVLVIGAGPVGLAVATFARLAAARTTLVDRAPGRLRSAQRLTDATLAAEVAPGARFDVVFDATGNAASMRAAFGLVAAGGRLVFVGLVQGEIAFDDPEFHRRETTLLATRNATAADFSEVIRRIEEGKVRPGPFVTHRLGLEELPTRFPAVRAEPELVKALVEVSP